MKAQRTPLYLLAGGRGRRDPAVKLFFQECGLIEPSVAYIGAASDDNLEFFQHISGYLRQMGAGAVTLAHTSKGARMAQTQKALENAGVIFISGGDVELGMETLSRRKLDTFLRELYRQGKPFFGISAGSIMLAREWVRWRDPDDVNTAELFPCLGLADVLCDTHDEESDWEELQAALALKEEGALGYGIAMGSGLRLAPESPVEALGGPVPRYIKTHGEVTRMADLQPVA
jgi:peptidase E